MAFTTGVLVERGNTWAARNTALYLVVSCLGGALAAGVFGEGRTAYASGLRLWGGLYLVVAGVAVAADSWRTRKRPALAVGEDVLEIRPLRRLVRVAPHELVSIDLRLAGQRLALLTVESGSRRPTWLTITRSQLAVEGFGLLEEELRRWRR